MVTALCPDSILARALPVGGNLHLPYGGAAVEVLLHEYLCSLGGERQGGRRDFTHTIGGETGA